jgi:hypothetical protein
MQADTVAGDWVLFYMFGRNFGASDYRPLKMPCAVPDTANGTISPGLVSRSQVCHSCQYILERLSILLRQCDGVSDGQFHSRSSLLTLAKSSLLSDLTAAMYLIRKACINFYYPSALTSPTVQCAVVDSECSMRLRTSIMLILCVGLLLALMIFLHAPRKRSHFYPVNKLRSPDTFKGHFA